MLNISCVIALLELVGNLPHPTPTTFLIVGNATQSPVNTQPRSRQHPIERLEIFGFKPDGFGFDNGFVEIELLQDLCKTSS